MRRLDGDTVPLTEDASEVLRRARVPDPRISLLFFHRAGGTLVSLEPGATVVVGREAPADVVIDDKSLSRQHARFSWQNGQVLVEDLGSTNGTRVDGETIRQKAVERGQVVALGAVTVAVHELLPSSAPRGVDGHDRFRALLEDDVARAKYFRRPLALLMVRGAGELHAWCRRVESLLRPVDRLAIYSRDCVEILLPELGAEAAEQLASRITASDEGAPDAAALDCGIAIYPDAATTTDKLLEACRSALLRTNEEERVVTAAADVPHPLARAGLATDALPAEGPVVESPAMRAVYRTVERLARSAIPVLLLGETGSGKEVVSAAIHRGGPRRDGPLVAVNCAAIPSQLVESTLFGHERGAFTGASQQHKGVFEAADGGTVLLDEIGELPPSAQAALLRVLETKRVQRVGATKEIDVDVRVIAATHRDLEAMCERGEFRTDLLFRLNVMTVTIPPLRARTEELNSLAARFLGEANATNGREVRAIVPEALALLERYAWPGNVRELRNVIERAVVVAEHDLITPDDLPERVRFPSAIVLGKATAPQAPTAAAAAAPPPTRPPPSAELDMKSQMQRLEAQVILGALKQADWNQSEAARELRIPLRTLVHKIKLYGIKKLGYGIE